jgi:hypothetical protein
MTSVRVTARQLPPPTFKLRGVPTPRARPPPLRGQTSLRATLQSSSPPSCREAAETSLPCPRSSPLPPSSHRVLPDSVEVTRRFSTMCNYTKTVSTRPSASTCLLNSTSPHGETEWVHRPLSPLSTPHDLHPLPKALTPSSPSTILPSTPQATPAVRVSLTTITQNLLAQLCTQSLTPSRARILLYLPHSLYTHPRTRNTSRNTHPQYPPRT